MPRRRVRRFFIGVALSIILIGAALAYTAWRLSWQQPTWYSPPNPRDDRVVRLADDAEYDLLQKTQQMRPEDERWTLRLTADVIALGLGGGTGRDLLRPWHDALGPDPALRAAVGLGSRAG